MARTTRWEARSKAAHTRPDQSLFGIVQGGFWPDLRKRSAEEIGEIGFDGYAVGGLSVGEGHDKMCEVLDHTTEHMPWDAPATSWGSGRPLDLVEGVARGIDMFDCVIQTRHARSGVMWTDRGRMRVSDRRYRGDMRPVDENCTCYTCQNFTRAYVHHLFRVGEVLGATLASVHNIAWFQQFMGRMRQSIVDGQFASFRKWVHEVYPEGAPAFARRGREGQGIGRSTSGRAPTWRRTRGAAAGARAVQAVAERGAVAPDRGVDPYSLRSWSCDLADRGLGAGRTRRFSGE